MKRILTPQFVYRWGPKPQELSPSLFTSSASFFAPAITTSYTITPNLFTNNQAFFAPTITLYITPSLFTNTNTFFDPFVSTGNFFPDLFTDTDTFFAPIVTTGPVDVAPSLFDDPDSIYDPSFVQSVLCVVNESVWYPFTITMTPRYNFPIGRGIESDYGIRGSKYGQRKYIIGRR